MKLADQLKSLVLNGLLSQKQEEEEVELKGFVQNGDKITLRNRVFDKGESIPNIVSYLGKYYKVIEAKKTSEYTGLDIESYDLTVEIASEDDILVVKTMGS